MRRVSVFMIMICLTTLINCDNNSEIPEVDCSISDLAIDVTDFTKSDCDVAGSVTVEATGGEENYTYSSDGVNFQDSPVFDDLFAGNFTFVVKDDVGCTAEVPFILESEPTGITLNLTGGVSDCVDNTGSITAIASGGEGILTFSLDGGDFTETTLFTGIGTGNHTVTVKDEEQCRVTKQIRIATTTSLADDIMPIILKDCAITSCHNGSQSPQLTDVSDVIANAARIKSETQTGSMPRNRTLTQAEIDLIACWVDDGALDN